LELKDKELAHVKAMFEQGGAKAVEGWKAEFKTAYDEIVKGELSWLA
jgi:hypothetical protein